MSDSQQKHIRVALYARVSTDEQREGQTIDAQIAEVERFAKDKAWTVTNVYKDEGWSGSLLVRPALDRLRDDATRGVFDAVIVNDVDRLARDVSHLGILKRDFERKRIQLIFRKLPAETSPTYNLMVNILGSFAEFERELIIDRTRRGRRHKVEIRKQYVGCIAAYAYHYERGSAADGMGCAWDFTPWRPWLESVLKQIDGFLGPEGKLIPPDAIPGCAYNLRRANQNASIRASPMRATLRQIEMRVAIRPGNMRLTMEDDSKGGKQKVWLCEAICPSCGKPVTLNVPDAVGVHYIHCQHCKKKILYKVEAGQAGPRITKVTDDLYLK